MTLEEFVRGGSNPGGHLGCFIPQDPILHRPPSSQRLLALEDNIDQTSILHDTNLNKSLTLSLLWSWSPDICCWSTGFRTNLCSHCCHSTWTQSGACRWSSSWSIFQGCPCPGRTSCRSWAPGPGCSPGSPAWESKSEPRRKWAC